MASNFIGSGGSPGGSDTQLQYNNGGAFGGTPSTYNKTTITTQFWSQIGNIDSSLLTAPALAGAGAGNLSNGAYRYKFTYVTANGQTAAGNPTAAVTVVDATTNGKVTVTPPDVYDSPGIFPTAINIYRTVHDGSTYKYVDQTDLSGDTYEDNIADASLGVTIPSANTAIEPSIALFGDGQLCLPTSTENWNGPTLQIGSTDASYDGGQIRIFAFGVAGTDLEFFGGYRTSGTAGALQLTGGQSLNGAGGPLRLYGGTGTTVNGIVDATGNQFTWNSTKLKIDVNGTITIATGQAIKTDTTTAHTALLQAYDVDGAAYATFATLTNGNTPDFTIAPPAGTTVVLQATTYKSSDGSTGATQDVTTGTLVGKTMTFKNGLLTSFA